MSKFYVVIKGHKPGIYRDWNLAKQQIYQFPRAVYKSFKTEIEAKNYQESFQTSTSKEDFKIYADGSFKDGKMGCGWLIYQNATKKVLFQAAQKVEHSRASNNVAELFAIYSALNYLLTNKNCFPVESQFGLYTDSNVSYQVINDLWAKAKYSGFESIFEMSKMVLNIDIIVHIIKILLEFPFKIDLHHVYGHQSDELNNLVDMLANQGREQV